MQANYNIFIKIPGTFRPIVLNKFKRIIANSHIQQYIYQNVLINFKYTVKYLSWTVYTVRKIIDDFKLLPGFIY